MSILNYNTALQSNNTDLQAILDAVNELPNNGVQVEWSENEDAILTRTLSTYFNNRIKSIVEDTFKKFSNLTTVRFPACTTIGNYAFSGCSSLTSVSFPACTSIGRRAFYYCSSLTSAIFPACTTIGEGAFYYCSSLTSVSFPVCTAITIEAFAKCFNLTTASFPACTSIMTRALYNCSHLTSLYLTGSSLCTLLNSSAFTATPIGGYSTLAGTYGSIYVPASLLTSYQTATNWTYFSSRFVAFDGGNNTITFTIGDTEYQAEEGMTWAEWVESEYNTDEYYINNNRVRQGVMPNIRTV